jgi:membrane-bound lytic murein transglycosylase D
MKELYAQLGDWYLAMAAYDWGAGNVQHSVQRTGYADFWELYRRNVLPQETKNYVPIIIAAAIMAKNPKQYGLESIPTDPPLMSDTVTTNGSVDLRLVADIVEAPVQEILALNPSLLRMSTPSDSPFDLHLPPGSKDLYEKRIAEIPEDKRNLWRFHKVTPGETLATIAREYHVNPSEIAFVNQIQPEDDLSAADSLVIPVAPAPSMADPARLMRYRVQRGDTLVTVADRFNVTVLQLHRWNRLHQNKLEPGRSIYVAEPAHISRSRRRSRSGGRTHSTAHGARSRARPLPPHTASTRASTRYHPASTRGGKTKAKHAE